MKYNQIISFKFMCNQCNSNIIKSFYKCIINLNVKNEHCTIYIYNNNTNYELQKYVFINEKDMYNLNSHNLVLI